MKKYPLAKYMPRGEKNKRLLTGSVLFLQSATIIPYIGNIISGFTAGIVGIGISLVGLHVALYHLWK